jgi:hypothetical protein
MATYQELMQAFKDQGISPDWTYQQRTQQYGSEGNSALDYGVDKIAPTITYNGVNYSYDPDKQTFSSGGEETKDPNTGWGRTYNLTTPEGTTQQRVRSKSDWEKLKPAVLALGGVLGLGALGPAGLGMFGGGGAGTAAAGGASGLPSLSSLGSAASNVAKLGSAASTVSKLLGGSGTKSGGAGGGAGASGSGGDGGIGDIARLLTARNSQTPFSEVKNAAYRPNSNLAAGNLYEASVAPTSQTTSSGIEQLQSARAAQPFTMFGESPETETMAKGGPIYMARGGLSGIAPREYAAGGKFLNGPGDGTSDSIRANIEGRQEARLADGEFVIPADVVSHIGNGSSKAGAKKLYAMMDKIRHARTGTTKMGKTIKADKYLPA